MFDGAIPTLNPLSNLHVLSSTACTVDLSGITAGLGEDQPLRVSMVSSNHMLIPYRMVKYPSPGSTGAIEIVPNLTAASDKVPPVAASASQQQKTIEIRSW